jgi:hypothetical protein
MPKFHKSKPWEFREVIGTTTKRAPDDKRYSRPPTYSTQTEEKLNLLLHGVLTLMQYQDSLMGDGIRRTMFINKTSDFTNRVRIDREYYKDKLLTKTDFAAMYTSLSQHFVMDNIKQAFQICQRKAT